VGRTELDAFEREKETPPLLNDALTDAGAEATRGEKETDIQ
jgi:hypothetical protein